MTDRMVLVSGSTVPFVQGVRMSERHMQVLDECQIANALTESSLHFRIAAGFTDHSVVNGQTLINRPGV